MIKGIDFFCGAGGLTRGLLNAGIGELYAEFVDGPEDTIGTTRNSLVWDTEANAALKDWGQKEINKIARTFRFRPTGHSENRRTVSRMGSCRGERNDAGHRWKD